MKRIIIIFFIFNSCQKVDLGNGIPKYTVFGILNPDDQKINIFVGKTYELEQDAPIDSGKYVPNAQVIININGRFKNLTFNPLTKNYEIVNDGFLNPKDEVLLKIKIENDFLESKTIIPERPRLQIEKSEVTNNQGVVNVSWAKTPLDNQNYLLTGTVWYNANNRSEFLWDNEKSVWKTNEQDTEDSTIKSPVGNFIFSSQFDQAKVTIGLISLDENWSEFSENKERVLRRTDFTKRFESPVFFKSNISNALGVFGSFVETEIEIILKKD